MVRLQLNIFLGTVYSTDDERNVPDSTWQLERGGRCFPVCTVVAAGDSNRRLHKITILLCR